MKKNWMRISGIIMIFVIYTTTLHAQETVTTKRALWSAADRMGWTLTASSQQPLTGGVEGPANLLIDGRESTWWHSAYGASVVPGVTVDVDFGKTLVVNAVLMQQRTQTNRQIKRFELFFKEDASSAWISGHAGTLTEATTKQTVALDTKKTARYMRIKITSMISGGSSNACLAELGVEIEESYLKSEIDEMSSFLELPVNSTIDRTTSALRSSWTATEPNSKTPILTVTPTSISESSPDFSKIISLTTNSIKWLSWKDGDWLNLEENRDTKEVTVSVLENNALETRQDTVYIAGGGIIRKIPVTQNGVQLPTSLIPTDIYVKPSGGRSTSSYSPSHTIFNLWDRNPGGNNYHTAVNWTANPKTEVLEFQFSQKPAAIDYLMYYHAAGSVNSMTISVKSGTSGTYTLLGTFPWSGVTKFTFPSQLQDVTGIKLSFPVAPNGGLVAIKELEFWAKNDEAPLNATLLNVFTDLSCSAVKAEALPADIDALPQFFKIIANKLVANTYHKAYRIDAYEAYSDPDEFASLRNTNAYSVLDNPTGIYANAGDSIYVLVGDTYGSDISIFSVSSGSLNRDYYSLKPGINKIKVTRTGLLYLKYFADLTTDPQPINIHIPEGSGIINGYWDIAKNTGSEWPAILANATHDVIDIVGEKFQAVFHTDELRQNLANSSDISESVQIWDDMVDSEWYIMGFYKYPLPQNNRMCGISFGGNGLMWATWYTTGYNRNTLVGQVLYPGVAQANKLWGMGHETGHCNQHPFNWKGMTESSNNTFAQIALDTVINTLRGITDATLDNAASDMENPAPYLTKVADNTATFYELNGWPKWGGTYYQFYLYFHKLGIYPDFYPDLFESLRNEGLGDDYYVAERQLNFYKRVCDIAQLDFTEHFTMYGYFEPFSIVANQYGEFEYTMTKEDADQAIAYVKAKNYPEPEYRTQFMHQHAKIKPVTSLNGYWTYYRDNAQIRGDISYTVNTSTRAVRVTNGKEAAVFAVETDGEIVLYSDSIQTYNLKY